ncbi:MAG: PAS domain S-box protein, partial [Halobacteria archaeon]|nr:PAS domain S-box protein [Halobacteria archaeon]
ENRLTETGKYRVLLLVEGDKDRELLEKWFSRRDDEYEVVSNAERFDEAEFIDLCILDAPSTQRNYDELREKKEKIEPVHLPYLLITSEKNLERMSEHDRELVDDFITTPIEKVELAERVNSLLHTRELSLRIKEKERRASEKFETFFEISPDPAFLMDEDGTVEEVNESFCRMVGHESDQIVGRTVHELEVFPDETANYLLDRFDPDSTKREIEAYTVEFDRADETGIRTQTRYAEINSVTLLQDEETPMEVVVLRDITERKRLEEELREGEESLRKLYEISSDTDLSLGEKINSILGIGRQRLELGFGFLTFIDREGQTQSIVEAIGTHEKLQKGEEAPLEKAYCRKTIDSDGLLGVENAIEDGWEGDPAYEEFGLNCYIGTKVVVDGELYGTLCFADSSPREKEFSEGEEAFVELIGQWVSYELERKERESELKRQNKRLEEFASMVSHDLRNPLSVAQARIEMVLEDGKNERQNLETIDRNLDRMEDIIEDILTFAREGDRVENPETIEFESAVENAWENVDTSGAELENEVGDVRIKADEDKLFRILENLFRNAAEHNDARGNGRRRKQGRKPRWLLRRGHGRGYPRRGTRRRFRPRLYDES